MVEPAFEVIKVPFVGPPELVVYLLTYRWNDIVDLSLDQLKAAAAGQLHLGTKQSHWIYKIEAPSKEHSAGFLDLHLLVTEGEPW